MAKLFFLSLILTLAPSLAVAAPPPNFECCKCTLASKEVKKDNVCLLTPTGKPCDVAQQTANNKTGADYKWTCTQLAAGSCDKIGANSSAVCINSPVTPETLTSQIALTILGQKASNSTLYEAAAPSLGVPIPGIVFPAKLEKENNKITVPYLAIYVVGFQKYLLALSLITAAVMIIFGGFKYLMASTGAGVQTGKEIIKDALIGTALVVSAYVVLLNINPQTASFKPMQVEVTERMGSPFDEGEAKKLVEQSAMTESGKPAQNPQNYIAQGTCPPDMVAIKHSDSYKIPPPGQNPPSYCMDRFEAPNNKGVKPFNGMYDIEADWWCAGRGKRLCTVDEWQRACLGPSGKNTYGYGDTFIPGKFDAQIKGFSGSDLSPAPCNYDTLIASNINDANPDLHAMDPPLIKGNGYPIRSVDSILNPANPNLSDPMYKTAYDKVMGILRQAGSEPSGKRPTCVTKEGVVDMVGNVQEIVLKREFKNIPVKQRTGLSFATAGSAKPYAWMSFYWSPVAHLGVNNSLVGVKPTCTQSWGGEHVLGWRAMENGFRCCMDLNENPSQNPSQTSTSTAQ